MLPLNWLEDKYKLTRFTRFRIEEGMLPCKLFPTRWIPVTLLFSTPTRYQVDTGLLVNQFVWSSQLGPSVLLYKSTSAKESCTFTCALAVFMFAQRANARRKIVDFVFIKHVLV